MTYDEILELFTSPTTHPILSTQEDLDINRLEAGSGFLIIGSYGVFPVKGVHSTTSRSRGLVDVALPDGADLGSLVFTRGYIIDSFNELTLQEFLAYLVDVPADSFGNLPYAISQDYFVSAAEMGHDYRVNFFDTAPLWGGFSHLPPPVINKVVIENLIAVSGIIKPSTHHIEAFSRYAHATSPLDRFLRLYHCVELLFDAITVFKIRALPQDIRGLSAILSDHESSEMGRLKMISKNFIHRPENMAAFFCSLGQHNDVGEKVFQTHSKKGNPLSPDGDSTRWSQLVSQLEQGKFSEQEWRDAGVLKQNEAYTAFVTNLASYWIYRVRCSIAHSRIGEYILEDADQGFVVGFAEPLLLEFCRQVFTSQDLNDLIN